MMAPTGSTPPRGDAREERDPAWRGVEEVLRLCRPIAAAALKIVLKDSGEREAEVWLAAQFLVGAMSQLVPWKDGPFRSGWESACEEILARMADGPDAPLPQAAQPPPPGTDATLRADVARDEGLAKVLAETYSRVMGEATRHRADPERAMSWEELRTFPADKAAWLAVANEATRGRGTPAGEGEET